MPAALIPFIPLIIAGVGAAGALGGTMMQMQGSEKAAAANEKIAQQQEAQMRLDMARQQRAVARNGIVARSTALSNATASGASYGATSGLQGGYGQIASQTNSALLGIHQNTQVASNIFQDQQSAFQGNSEAATGQGISTFGNFALNNVGNINKAGGYMSNLLSGKSNAWA